MSTLQNIAERLTKIAGQFPNQIAIAEPNGRTMTFAELDADTDGIAAALHGHGLEKGMKIALFVHYGIDFISLVFALCKTGAVLVLIDPGMGIRRMLKCLEEVEPDGFIAVPAVHWFRLLYRRRFPQARFNITVGKRWCWGGLSLSEIRRQKPSSAFRCTTQADDPAAIIFTSGSTGPAKGVAFTHRIFGTQAEQIQKRYGIQPGEIDLACFPFFGLFDAAMGVTAIIPPMNTSKPAMADPAKLLETANRWKITQSFASPAVWNNVALHCLQTGKRFETLKRAVSAGAPVSDNVLEKLSQVMPEDGGIFTPYGATEALPTASISYKERKLMDGTNIGVCVGKRFETIDWRVIKITDKPIGSLEDAEILPNGEIGELAVTGPQVTKEYVNRPQANAAAKMCDRDGNIWHRIGDVGYLDAEERFWFCGRKAHRVVTAEQTYFSIPCEAVFNRHPKVFRSALANSPQGLPRMFVEPLPEHFPKNVQERSALLEELRQRAQGNPLTKTIRDIRILKVFPVDVRHNVKINRELLATFR